MTNFLLAAQGGGIAFTVIFAIASVVIFAVAVWLLCLGLRGIAPEFKLKAKNIFIVALVIGAVIRMVMAFTMKGIVGFTTAFSSIRAGYSGIFSMTNYLVSNGFNGFMKMYDSVFFYPLTMYILTFFGSALSLFTELSASSVATVIFLKLPFVISDILLAVFVYGIAKKYAGEIVGLATGGLVALCPVFMLGSIYPSVYSFFAVALVAMLYFMLERKYIKLIITYSISLLICFESIFLLPIVATFVIYAYAKKIIAFKYDKNRGKLWGSQHDLIIKLPIAVVACMVVSYLITLPFVLDTVGANPFKMLYVYYLKPFDTLGYFTYNGLSLYALFGKNGNTLSLSFPTYAFSVLFMIAIVAITLIIYLSRKNRANLLMFVSFALFTVNTYFVDSSELTLIPCLAALLLAIAVLKDRRLVQIFGITALLVFVNACGVLLNCGYFTLESTYVAEVLSGSWRVVGIILSAMAVLVHIYYTAVVLDIVMNGDIKRFEPKGDNFKSALVSLIK